MTRLHLPGQQPPEKPDLVCLVDIPLHGSTPAVANLGDPRTLRPGLPGGTGYYAAGPSAFVVVASWFHPSTGQPCCRRTLDLSVSGLCVRRSHDAAGAP